MHHTLVLLQAKNTIAQPGLEDSDEDVDAT